MSQYQIYYLNADPVQCAREHCDKHVRTQCFELGLLLSYVYRCRGNDPTILAKIYSPALDQKVDYFAWLSKSCENYKYVYSLWKELLIEHAYRFDKEHVSLPLLPLLEKNPIKNYWREREDTFTTPLCKVPVKYQLDHNKKPYAARLGNSAKRSTLNSYRNWYQKEFSDETYTKRDKPTWLRTEPALVPAPPTPIYRTLANHGAATRTPTRVRPRPLVMTEEAILDELLRVVPRQ